MPANAYAAQIAQLQSELDAQAAVIQTKRNEMTDLIFAYEEALDIMTTRELYLMDIVLNERFTINNNLMYTNDKQRRIRLDELELTDQDYQTAKNVVQNCRVMKEQKDAEIQIKQKLWESKYLVMKYYSNNP